MIFGDLANWENEKKAYSPAIAHAIDFLRYTDVASREPGTYEIPGYDRHLMYAMVQMRTTRRKSPALKPESHLQYIDVHYICEGEELIGYARRTDDLSVAENLSDQSDTFLYHEFPGETDLVLKEGNYAVFFPDDVHRPGCAPSRELPLKKVVLKIHTSLL